MEMLSESSSLKEALVLQQLNKVQEESVASAVFICAKLRETKGFQTQRKAENSRVFKRFKKEEKKTKICGICGFYLRQSAGNKT